MKVGCFDVDCLLVVISSFLYTAALFADCVEFSSSRKCVVIACHCRRFRYEFGIFRHHVCIVQAGLVLELRIWPSDM